MKRILLYLLIPVLMLSSCTEDDPEFDTPRTAVPADMVGKWMYGSFNMIQFWKYDGSYEGPGFQLAVVFNFNQEGLYEYYFAAETNNYGCKTQAFSFHKGTVEFHDNNSFTIHPQEGNYRGFYNCSPDSNFNREPNADELKSQTFYYSFEEDSYGKEYLVIRFDADDEQGSYFKPTDW